ncbi:MAG: TIGR00730 family Rossman fold protein [Candidatus Pacebacteria bacterium]|nr:TIGR00730 family Rossman fold protein [Candidatus Paceibacterota bacterium]
MNDSMPPEPINTPAGDDRNHVMGQRLSSAIEEGKQRVPELPDPLVSKPNQLESWRVFKIMSEFVEGFDLIRKYSLAATFFGSARETFDSQIYLDATDLAARLAKAGFAVITGGSSGVMQAANKGAFEAGGSSVGLNIRLEDKQAINKYVTDGMTFDHFFVRKVMLTFASEVYIYFPGGFGTFDEFFEILTLVQTKKIRPVPIVMYDSEYWNPIVALFKEKLLNEYHSIDATDLDLFKIVDTVDEAFEYISKTVLQK